MLSVAATEFKCHARPLAFLAAEVVWADVRIKAGVKFWDFSNCLLPGIFPDHWHGKTNFRGELGREAKRSPSGFHYQARRGAPFGECNKA